jgi:hypothetical protein
MVSAFVYSTRDHIFLLKEWLDLSRFLILTGSGTPTV